MKALSRPAGAVAAAPPRATYLIKELERAVRVRIDEIVAPLGLTAVQYTALSALARHPGMSSAQLARRSFVSAQATNELVTALERRGLIRRRADPEGGRVLLTHLTAFGERTLTRCDQQTSVLEAQLFRGLTRREEAQFREMLRTCRDAVRAQPALAARPGRP
jgi:DNA-binding MarR family transcriptional regulator